MRIKFANHSSLLRSGKVVVCTAAIYKRVLFSGNSIMGYGAMKGEMFYSISTRIISVGVGFLNFAAFAK